LANIFGVLLELFEVLTGRLGVLIELIEIPFKYLIVFAEIDNPG